jgi:hypothetical protein
MKFSGIELHSKNAVVVQQQAVERKGAEAACHNDCGHRALTVPCPPRRCRVVHTRAGVSA